MSETSSLVLDPWLDSNAKDFNPENNVHIEELKRVVTLIKTNLQSLPDFQEKSMDPDELPEEELRLLHQHDAIFVDGERGAGKTSFILSLKAALNGPSGDLKIDHVLVLDSLDPSLMEESEVFLAAVISNLLRAVQRGLKPRSGTHAHPTLRFDEQLSTALELLGESLRVLFPSGLEHIQKQAVDARGLAKELLKDAGTAIRLGERFHRFVMACARKLGVKGFVQPIDDVDTAFTRAWTVLETIRRFLGSKRFQVVLAGDMKLFELLVRQEKLLHLEPLQRLEPSRTGRIHSEVDTLQDQYLLKLLAPQRRIRLKRLRDLLFAAAAAAAKSSGESQTIKMVVEDPLKRKSSNKEVGILSLLKAMHQEVFGWREGEAASTSFFLPEQWPPALLFPQNLRMATRFLILLSQWDQEAQKSRSPAARLEALLYFFEWELREEGLTVELMMALMKGEDYSHLTEWLLERIPQQPGLLSFNPHRVSDPDADRTARLQRVVLLLQAVLHHAARRNPGEVFCQVAAIWRPAKGHLDGDYPSMTKGEQQHTAVSSWLRLKDEEPPWVLTWRCSGLRMPSSPGLTVPGAAKLTIKLNADHRKKVVSYFYTAKSENPFWDALLSSGKLPASRTQRYTALIPPLSDSRFDSTTWAILSIFRTGQKVGPYTYIYLDFWKGITLLAEMLRTPDITSQQVDSLIEGYEDYAVRVPSSTSSPKTGDEDEEDEDEPAKVAVGTADKSAHDKTNASQTPSFVKELHAWIQECSSLSPASIAILPRVWLDLGNRLEKNLRALDDELRARDYTVAALLERWVSLFLHHLLLAEATHSGYTSKLDSRNLISLGLTQNVFVRNVDMLYKDLGETRFKEHFPLLHFWAECPLFKYLLKPELREHLHIEVGRLKGSYKPTSLPNAARIEKLEFSTLLSGLFVVPTTEKKGDAVTRFERKYVALPEQPKSDTIVYIMEEWYKVLAHLRTYPSSDMPTYMWQELNKVLDELDAVLDTGMPRFIVPELQNLLTSLGPFPRKGMPPEIRVKLQRVRARLNAELDSAMSPRSSKASTSHELPPEKEQAPTSPTPSPETPK